MRGTVAVLDKRSRTLLVGSAPAIDRLPSVVPGRCERDQPMVPRASIMGHMPAPAWDRDERQAQGQEEGLTNALEHAPGGAVDVHYRRGPDHVVVDLASTSGRGHARRLSSNAHGPVGMRAHAGPRRGRRVQPDRHEHGLVEPGQPPESLGRPHH